MYSNWMRHAKLTTLRSNYSFHWSTAARLRDSKAGSKILLPFYTPLLYTCDRLWSWNSPVVYIQISTPVNDVFLPVPWERRVFNSLKTPFHVSLSRLDAPTIYLEIEAESGILNSSDLILSQAVGAIAHLRKARNNSRKETPRPLYWDCSRLSNSPTVPPAHADFPF